MAFELLLLIALLALTALFSGAETALFSLNRHELNQFRQDRRPSHRLVADLMRSPRQLLLTLMIGNVTINMFIFSASLSVLEDLPGRWVLAAPVLGLVSPVLVTLLGDLLPKSVAIVGRTRLAPLAAPAIRLCQLILTPLSWLLGGFVVAPMTRLLVGGHRPEEYVTVEELRELVEMCEQHRWIDADENAMLTEVVRLGELKVRDIMVPRVDMMAFEVHDDPDELRRILREQRLSKLPVYDTTIDEIVGLIYAKDLFLNPDKSLDQLVRSVRFVPEIISLTQLLTFFRQTHTQLAIAVSETGGVVGLVTVEDVAEQIVGELSRPEEKDEGPLWERLDDRRYRVSGQVNIRRWGEHFKVRHLDDRVSTLAGLMLARLGRVPAVGDRIQISNLLLTVDTLDGRRIDRILLELLPEPKPLTAGVTAGGGGP